MAVGVLGLAAGWRMTGRPVAGPPAVVAPAGPPRVVLGDRAVRIEVGAVPRGGWREVAFVVVNPGPAAVTVGPVRTSCDCLTVELDATRIEAGAEVGGRAVIDLTREPGAGGWLLLDASAVAGESGRPVFAIKLSVEVIRSP